MGIRSQAIRDQSKKEAKETDSFMGGATKEGCKDCDYGHPKKSGHNGNSMQFGIVMLVAQIAFIVLFGIFVRYNGDVGGFGGGTNTSVSAHETDEELSRLYPWFQDTHVMIIVGFGFLMTLDRMIEAEFTTGAILISFGAVLGVASPVQLIFMVLFEVVFYNLNAYILVHFLDVSDIGGSMVIHAFGAYYGLALARALYKQDGQMDNHAEGTEYHSDVFSMIGTVFLWMFWPSFNSAPGGADGSTRYYAVVNTYLALCAACVSTFIFSTITNPKKRVTMEHVQNATLAGGVAMGTAADMAVQPYGALVIGFVAGALSTLGYAYIKPFLAEKISLHDTCGVNNLHGMPAILAAVVSIVTTAINRDNTGLDNYGAKYGDVGDSPRYLMQLYSLLCTLGIALVGGAVTGMILRIPAIEHLTEYEYFEDGKYWEIEEEEDEE